MSLSRRNIFHLIAGAASCSALSASALTRNSESIPMLYCDELNCDIDALHALIAGKPVYFTRPSLADRIGWTDEYTFTINNVRMLWKKPLAFETFQNRGGTLLLSNCKVICDFPSDAHGATMQIKHVNN